MLNRSRTRKNRRRRAAYGRSLYKINNDTSTKFIEGIVIIIVIIVVIIAVRSRRIIVLKKVTSHYSFFLAWPLDARARGQSSRDKCVRLECISRLLVNDPHLPYIYSTTRAFVCKYMQFVSL